MKHSNPQRRSRSCPTPLTATAVGAALLIAAFAAQAQEATQTVTVTGIRKGIEEAISVKRNSESIVEALNSEDIGKMPDATIAESMARLPGVTAQRDSNGRAKNISVRGMSPDFNGGLMNGREMASTGDSRGVEFDQFPAELLSSVVIYKTPDATLVGQGLASTIDLRTVRPLDFGKRTVAVNYRKTRTGVNTGSPEGEGDRQSLSYIDQFFDRKVGVAIGFARTSDTGAAVSNGGGNAWGRWGQELAVPGGSAFAPAGFGEDVIQNTAKRDAGMAVFQFKPNKDFESTVDVFWSKGSFATKKTGIEGGIACQPPSKGGYNDPQWSCANHPYVPVIALDTTKPYTITTVDGKDYLSAGTAVGIKGVVRNHMEAGADELSAWGWNNKFKAAGFQLSTDLSYSKVKRESDRFETTAGIAGKSTLADTGTATWTGFTPGSDTFEKNFQLGGINYADRGVAKLTDVMGWSGGESFPQAGYNAHPTVTDTIKSGRLSARRDVELGLVNSLEFGLNFTERTKIRTAPEGVLRVGTDPYGAATVPGSGLTHLPTMNIDVVSFDPRGSVGSIFTRVDKIDKDILNKDWTVQEKVSTGYVKASVEGTLMGLPVTGNAGLQMVQTNQSSTGFNVDGVACKDAATCTSGARILSTAEHNYLDVNPSLNLNFDLGSSQIVRAGLARVLARPNMNDMRSSMTYTAGTGTYTGEAGNPNLEPYRAISLDLSYEKYFGNKGYVAVAGFYKELDSYIIKSSTQFDFTKLVGTVPSDMNPLGTLTQPVNGQGGSISGVELSANIPFNLLTPVLDGFGVMASASMTESSVSLPASGLKVQDINLTNIPLPGLSKNVFNLRAYYEKHGFQVSIGARQRSDFLGEISNFQDERSLTFIKGDTVIDFQAAYEFETGLLKGLSAMFQANNVTDAAFERYRDTPANSLGKVKYGRTYIMGVNYKF